jgi:hypothetical protein
MRYRTPSEAIIMFHTRIRSRAAHRPFTTALSAPALTALSLTFASCASTGGAGAPPTPSQAGPAGAAPAPQTVDAKDDLAIATMLDGYRWELPCENPDPAAYKPKGVCPWDPALLAKGSADDTWKLKIEDTKTLGGRPDTVYAVTLRFRGVSEPKNYEGGTAASDHFYVGGTEVRSDYNIYSIRVSDPPQTYYLTRHERKTGHFTFAFDYTAAIEARGGATLTLGLYDHNTKAIANGEQHVVADIPPAPKPYSGHFIQMNVVGVKALAARPQSSIISWREPARSRPGGTCR